ncbi:MAG: lipopolysaccharide assembly protein LapA domain-containing protein [Solirubrobacterales bacterium]
MSDLPTPEGGASGKWRLYVSIGAIILAAIFTLQNSQEVPVDFLFTTTTTPLVFALLFAGILGFVIGLALPRFRQPRR